MFDIWGKMSRGIIEQVDEIGPRVPQGGQHRSNGGTSHRFRKTDLKTKRATAGINQATGSNMGANIWNFGVFRMISFDGFPHHFLEVFKFEFRLFWDQC